MQRIPLNSQKAPNADVIAFVAANGIDPNEVIADQLAYIANSQLTVDVFVRRDDGTKVLDHSGDRYTRGSLTVPLLSAPENHNLRSL
ncbi:hypothetical protein ART_0175 [Arthrobacter sp. PAMC 25486]|uniref:hypothetical protein n=1 Tax=Arthrobacter sp. PAMC 25486 TaxID=1494608 RepID=UPI000535BED6|nr:hypothetical protein [Arthrobacter sp. PAMC 25486]AIX99773.1 hypothetical protein ART_0175 [Arthrobacter sp. PAMC 25486]